MDEINTNVEQAKHVRRGDLRPKTDLVQSMYVRLVKWGVTEDFNTEPEYVRAVRELGKFVAKHRKTTP